MKIVNIIGGLGNQMFQYAFAVALKSEFHDEIVKINTLYFNGYAFHNGFELDRIFNLTMPRATLKDLIYYAWPIPHYRCWQICSHILPRRKGMVYDTDFVEMEFSYPKIGNKEYFDGYWQSPVFFEKYKENIKKIFVFPSITDSDNLKVINWINGGKTAFIHIRRGDYVKHPLFDGICDLDYYKKGIAQLQIRGFNRFLVFSNDIEWCESNISRYIGSYPTVYVDWNKGKNSYRDMQVMSKCKGALIANSSFSWWGAWLGEMEVVLCPYRWTNKDGLLENIYPDDWIKIS